MQHLQIRQHDRNAKLWWVSRSGEDVAYITHPGKGYRAWPTRPARVDFVGKSFDSVEAALAAVARSLV